MHHFVDHGNHPQTGTIVPCPNCSNGAPPDQSSRESYSRRKGREQPTDRATRVLVVDDEIDGRNALVQLLSLSGFVINCLQSGAAALLEPSLSTYDVIVLDLHLPDILGLTLLSEWRRRGVTAPVIVMTGWYGEAGHEHAARSLGAAAFMRKPLDATNLQAEIASAISGKTPRAIVPYVVHNDRHGSLSSVAAYRKRLLDASCTRVDATVLATQEGLTELLSILERRLRAARLYGATEDHVHDAAVDAIQEHFDNPTRHDPSRSSLTGYLYVAARRNLINLLRSEQRRRVREAVFAAGQTAVTRCPLAQETSVILEQTLRQITKGFGPVEVRVLAMWLDGERRTEAFSRVLPLAHCSAAERRMHVRRVKERLIRRVQRWMSRNVQGNE